MTVTVVFDKLSFVRRLEAEGQFTRAQAEAMSEAFHQAVNETVATKTDLAEIRGEMGALRIELRSEIAELRGEFGVFRAEMRSEFDSFRHEIRHDMAVHRTEMAHSIDRLRTELKLWMGSLAAALFASLSGMAALLRFIGH